MSRKHLTYAIFIAIAAVFFILINAIRPINETALISQLQGTDIATPYLGRTIMIVDGQTLTQTFRAPRDGRLNGFGILLPGLNRRSKGLIQVELTRDAQAGSERLLSTQRRVGRLSNNEGPSIWRIKPLDVSRGDRFTIKVKVQADNGLTVFVSSGNAYKGGIAYIDNQKLGKDIGFQVYFGLSLAELLALLGGSGPNLLSPSILMVILLALIIVVGFWFQGLYTAFYPLGGATALSEPDDERG